MVQTHYLSCKLQQVKLYFYSDLDLIKKLDILIILYFCPMSSRAVISKMGNMYPESTQKILGGTPNISSNYFMSSCNLSIAYVYIVSFKINKLKKQLDFLHFSVHFLKKKIIFDTHLGRGYNL